MVNKKFIGIAIIYYLIAFIVSMSVAVALGVDVSSGAMPGPAIWLLNLIILTILLAIISIRALKKQKNRTQAGHSLGLTVLTIGILMDIIVGIVFYNMQGLASVQLYYSNAFVYLTYFIYYATPTVIGKFSR